MGNQLEEGISPSELPPYFSLRTDEAGEQVLYHNYRKLLDVVMEKWIDFETGSIMDCPDSSDRYKSPNPLKRVFPCISRDNVIETVDFSTSPFSLVQDQQDLLAQRLFYYLGWASDKPHDRGHLDYKEFLAASKITFFRDNPEFLAQAARRAQEAHDSGKRFVAIEAELNSLWVIREEDLPLGYDLKAPIEVQLSSFLPYASVRNWNSYSKTGKPVICPPEHGWYLFLDRAGFFQAVRERLEDTQLSDDYEPLFGMPTTRVELIKTILSNLQSVGRQALIGHLKDPDGVAWQEKLAAIDLAACRPDEDLLNEIARLLEQQKQSK